MIFLLILIGERIDKYRKDITGLNASLTTSLREMSNSTSRQNQLKTNDKNTPTK